MSSTLPAAHPTEPYPVSCFKLFPVFQLLDEQLAFETVLIARAQISLGSGLTDSLNVHLIGNGNEIRENNESGGNGFEKYVPGRRSVV